MAKFQIYPVALSLVILASLCAGFRIKRQDNTDSISIVQVPDSNIAISEASAPSYRPIQKNATQIVIHPVRPLITVFGNLLNTVSDIAGGVIESGVSFASEIGSSNEFRNVTRSAGNLVRSSLELGGMLINFQGDKTSAGTSGLGTSVPGTPVEYQKTDTDEEISGVIDERRAPSS